jgi:hypothetical protein
MPKIRAAIIALAVCIGVLSAVSQADAVLGTTLTLSPGGSVEAAPAAFGPSTFNVTGTVIEGVDAVAPTADGCSALTNTVTGMIVLVDRGLCPFEQKVLNAQNAGAIAVIVANDAMNPLGSMADNAMVSGVTIPSVMVGNADGAAIRANLASGPVTATMTRADADGDLIPDDEDNCVSVSNLNQADADSDATGDACDADDDDDGVTDASDSCPLVAGTGANGCFVERTISLRYSRSAKTFSGRLSGAGHCAANKEVSVFRAKRGPDTLMGQDNTDGFGNFSLVKRAKRGKYYASVAEQTMPTFETCGAARSSTVRVR